MDDTMYCSVARCTTPAVLDIGACERCWAMFCAGHRCSPIHECSDRPLDNDEWDAAQVAELRSLDDTINWAALLTHATDLAGGVCCRAPERDDGSDRLGRGRMGGMHVHHRLVFDDGREWLARVPRMNFTSPSDATTNDMVMSECATLKWLAVTGCGLPTPRVYGYGLRGDPNNKVGVAYMLVDKMPGRPFDMASASEAQRVRVLEQWAAMLHRLSKHPLESMGSLVFSGTGSGVARSVVVGAVACDRTGTLPRTIGGPYPSASAFYKAWANSYVELIKNKQLFSEYRGEALRMFNYIAHRLSNGWLDRWRELDNGPFFLKHMDDKGNHLLVDADGTITGIIDWTFARVVPAYEAFGPSLLSADNKMLFRGRAGLSDNDKILGRALAKHELPYAFFASDELRQLMFGLGTGMGFSRSKAVSAFSALLAAFGDRNEISKAVVSSEVTRFAACSWTGCSRPSVRGRSCDSCHKHVCAIHIQPRFHGHCVSQVSLDEDAWEQSIHDEVKALLAKTNVPALVDLASSLRGGVHCQFVPGKYIGDGAAMGCANYHATLLFDDGTRWIVRIPRTEQYGDIPDRLIEYLVASEYATLQFLENDMPSVRLTPRAYAFGLESDPENRVGVNFILEDAMDGRPFYSSEATVEEKTRVYTQYAAFLAAVARAPQPRACSLMPGLGPSPLASDRFLKLDMDVGPFESSLDYYTTIAETHMDLVADGQLYVEYPQEAFLFYRLLRDRAAPILALPDHDVLVSKSAPAPASERKPELFFLKHPDDKGDHILVNDDGNITAIIDWQYARFAPASEAFGPSLVTADMDAVYGGRAGLSDDDRLLASAVHAHLQHSNPPQESTDGTRDGAVHIQEVLSVVGPGACTSDLARRFHFGLASGLNRDEALGMIQAVLDLVHAIETRQPGQPGGLDISGRVENVQDWLRSEWETAQYDARCAKIECLLRDLQESSGAASVEVSVDTASE